MTYLLEIGIKMANVLFRMLQVLPIQNKIVYISRQENKAPQDFLLMQEKMEQLYPKCKNVILAKTLEKGIWKKITYMFHMLRQMFHIATAKVIVLDSYCILVSILNLREEQVVIQMWHALGALKKFGYSVLDKKEGHKEKIARTMRMHKNYSYVFCSSENCKSFYAEAFSQDMEKIKVYPLPRVDLLLDEKWKQFSAEKIKQKYPQLGTDEKKVLLYAPTFRKGENTLEKAIYQLLDEVDFERYNLVMKLHPLCDITIESRDGLVIDREFTTQEMFNVCDCVITDYSAVMLEAALMRKPIYLYTFDMERYIKERDFYIEFQKDLKEIIERDAKKLIQSIEKKTYESKPVEHLLDSMIDMDGETSYTDTICQFIYSHFQ